MGIFISRIFPKKEPPRDYDLEFENWKKELFQNRIECECIFDITFENPKYYVKGSAFYDKVGDEPLGFRIYIKSQGRFEYNIVDDETNEECAVCSEMLQKKKNKKYIRLRCGHDFHEKCFMKWAQTKWKEGGCPSCPICRYECPNDDEEIHRLKIKEIEERIEYQSSISSYGSDY